MAHYLQYHHQIPEKCCDAYRGRRRDEAAALRICDESAGRALYHGSLRERHKDEQGGEQVPERTVRHREQRLELPSGLSFTEETVPSGWMGLFFMLEHSESQTAARNALVFERKTDREWK